MRKSQRGFTLVELLVVIGISALLTGIFIGFSSDSRNQIKLNLEKIKIAKLIQRAKTLTLAGFTSPPSNPPPCSYGFMIDYTAEEIGIFTYHDPSGISCQEYNSIANLPVNDPAAFEFLDPKNPIQAGVKFNKSQSNLGYILFLPPNLEALIFDQDGVRINGEGKIILETVSGSFSGEILIGENGQIRL